MTEGANEVVDRLAQVLAAAGPAHHAAYIATDGEDPEWPQWYAEHIAGDVREALGRPELTMSRLVWALVDSADAHAATNSDIPWHRFYAERFSAELPNATNPP